MHRSPLGRRALITGAAALAATAAVPGAASARAASPEPQAGALRRAVPTVVTSNLGSPAALARARRLLADAGVSAARIAVVERHVRQVNRRLPAGMLVAGFEPMPRLGTAPERFDPYAAQEAWDAAHPDFVGYNCRITAFGLWSRNLRLTRVAPVDDTALAFDLLALEQDPSMLLSPHERFRFRTLYQAVPTVASTDPHRHERVLRRWWRSRGIHLRRDPRMSLISVVQHDLIERHELFIGHTGVLLPASDGLWLLEKLAFQAPYQLTRFASRSQLVDHLNGLYDTHQPGVTSPNLILEDDRLIAGYRPAG